MLHSLLRRLTTTPAGAELFDAATAEARRPHWYTIGGVADTIDGRFAMLATVLALIMVRLEEEGEAGERVSVALTERFVTVMESEHRELGLGDPALGRRVRKLVGSLARRVQLWRTASIGGPGWGEAVQSSIYKTEPSAAALDHSAAELEAFARKIARLPLAALAEGHVE
jgi:cytochrome b pre-mRNA-processing protein 3